MLSSISWSEFLTTIALLLVAYYVAIVSLYFRKEVFNLFSSGTSNPQGFHLSNQIGERSFSYNEMTAATGKEDPYVNGKVHDLLEDVKNLFRTGAKAKIVREELIMALQLLLRDYPIFKDLPLRAEINHHIITECKSICSITLSDAEMNMLWNG